MVEREPRKSGENFDRSLTPDPEVVLRIELGTKPKVRIEVVRALKEIARKYLTTHRQEKGAKGKLDKLKQQILEIIGQIPQLRGIEFSEEKVGLNFIPVPNISYDKDLLKQGLGPFYPRVVKEEAAVELRLPTGGIETPTGIIRIDELHNQLIETLKNRGMDEAQVRGLVNLSVKPKVNEEELNRLIDEGVVKLPEGARNVEPPTWTIKPFKIQ